MPTLEIQHFNVLVYNKNLKPDISGKFNKVTSARPTSAEQIYILRSPLIYTNKHLA